MSASYRTICPNCKAEITYKTEDIVHLYTSAEDVIKCPMCLEYVSHNEADKIPIEESFSSHVLKAIEEIKRLNKGDMIYANTPDLIIYGFEKEGIYRITASKKK